jgi:DNA-directed RNA polymerase subunit alpha
MPMRIRWRGLELPTQVVRDETISTDTYARLMVEPFERGFGTTVGNSLRRILLSSLEGAAVTRVRIAGANHEFMSLPGVYEDVTDIILNIKNLVLRLEGEGERTMRLVRKGPGEVFARDIEADPSITIMNEGQLIATLTEPVELSIDFWVSPGRGYRTSEENQEAAGDELGVIAVDSVFSPVTRVRYKTEETRVGHRTNYDRLIMEIWTKGTITPEDALVEAAKILRKHLNPFVQFHELGQETIISEQVPAEGAVEGAIDKALQERLSMPISQLDLSVRASNCLESAKVNTVGELARMSETDLLKVRSFGRTSLREVKRKLADLGLSLGMNLPEGATSAQGGEGGVEDQTDGGNNVPAGVGAG